MRQKSHPEIASNCVATHLSSHYKLYGALSWIHSLQCAQVPPQQSYLPLHVKLSSCCHNAAICQQLCSVCAAVTQFTLQAVWYTVLVLVQTFLVSFVLSIPNQQFHAAERVMPGQNLPCSSCPCVRSKHTVYFLACGLSTLAS